MKLRILTLTICLFFSIFSFAQETPPTINPINETFDIDSLLNEVEELEVDSLRTTDETIYKNIWNSTQIRYPANTLPDKRDTVVISINGLNDNSYVHPYKGKVISKYGPRRGRMHTGIDIKLNSGDTVLCAFDGRVRLAKRFNGYGNLVLVRHNNGLETIYGHLKSIKVKVNDTIKAGDLIGLGGRTGRATCDHLHFETRLFGEPFNSDKYIDFENYSLRTDKIYYANKRFEIDKNNFKKKPLASDGAALAAAGGKTKHVIRKGDTLSAIARKYRTSVTKICTANKITARTTLKIGKVLWIN
ncbi:MAG: peptidoglycan DD-metalloendopeptidase family protein [Prolixibacteraceae bacterium]|nr:peptidoglycan DD-metalloendopeptidase family protein [Prolixibacteraceae bacterium]